MPIPTIQERAIHAYATGLAHLIAAKGGDPAALQQALIQFNIALEFATPEEWPDLWLEAHVALNEARSLINAAA